MIEQRSTPIPKWLHELPKVELHVHLEGTVGPSTLNRLAERNGLDSTAFAPQAIARLYHYSDFPGFIDTFTNVSDCIRTPEDLGMITYDYGVELARQNVMYAEVHYIPEPHQRRKGIPFGEGLAAMNAARERVRSQFGVQLRWIADGVRDAAIGPRSVDITLDWTIDAGPESGIVALGLGGNEAGHPARDFRRTFQRARAEGINVVAHAGETQGPEAIWETIHELGASRIGHGISAGRDERLLEHLAKHDIALEICPSSNLRTGVVSSLDDIPFESLIINGAPFSISSDDPPMFDTSVEDEYNLVRMHLDLDADEMTELVSATIDQSFAEPELKRQMKSRLQAFSDDIQAREDAASISAR